MKISSRALVAAVAAVSLGSTTAYADTWTNPGVGDWFDPANWAGSGPYPYFPVFIDNGGTAIADPTSPLYTGGPIQTGFLHLGVAIVDGSQPPGATGHVQVNNLDVFTNNTLVAGYSALGGSTHGSLQITGGDLEVNAGTSSVGVARDGASQATGSVLINGGNASFTSGLSIGIALAPDNPGQGAFADGSFTVSTGSLSAGSLTVGSAIGTTSAQGSLDVAGDLTLTGSGLTVGMVDQTSVAAGNINAGGSLHYGDGGQVRVGYSTGGVAGGAVNADGPGLNVALSRAYVGRALNGGVASGSYETLNAYTGLDGFYVGTAYMGGNADGTFLAGSLTGGDAAPWLYTFVGVLEAGAGSASGYAIIPGTVRNLTPAGPSTYLQVGAMNGLSEGITSGDAEGLLTVAEGIIGFSNLRVGFAANADSGFAQGTLISGFGDIAATPGTSGSALVGYATSGASTNGDLRIQVGDLTGYQSLSVGFSSAAGSASGSVELENGSLDLLNGPLTVGYAVSTGGASGSVIVNGSVNISHTGAHNIGFSTAGGATGSFTAGSGTVTGSNIRVGYSAGGSAVGQFLTQADVTASLIDVGFSDNGTAVGRLAANSITVDGAGSVVGLRVGEMLVGTGSVDGRVEVQGALTAAMPTPNSTWPGLGIGLLGTVSSGSTNGQALGSVEVGAGITGFSSIRIASAFPQATGLAQGALEVTSGGISGNGLSGITVGVTTGAGDAQGELRVVGDINGYTGLSVGQSSGGEAVGEVTLHDGFSTFAGAVNVGRSSVAGQASGSLTLRDAFLVSDGLRVGELSSGGSRAQGLVRAEQSVISVGGTALIGWNGTGDPAGEAIAAVELTESVLTTTGDIAIAPHFDAPLASGRLELRNALAITQASLVIGAGGELIFEIAGPDRTDGNPQPGLYSAIDAHAAAIGGGMLVAEFTFLPTAGDVFDLIRTDQPDGIGGAFDNVMVLGLPDAAIYSYGIAFDDMGNEVYRLSVSAVPEPGSLLLAPLAGLLCMRRRR